MQETESTQNKQSRIDETYMLWCMRWYIPTLHSLTDLCYSFHREEHCLFYSQAMWLAVTQ
jgi:hypothetical protein